MLIVGQLTGDNATEAQRISQQLCIPVLASSATPNGKLQHVKSLQEEGHKVAMVCRSFCIPNGMTLTLAQIGDGINDAPSLAASDVGIMIAHGNRCLSAGGNILILASKLESLLTLFEVSDQTMRQVRANVRWALVYNAVAISLSMGVGHGFGFYISPSIAAAMMSASSMAITIQSLRLRQRLLGQAGV